VIALYSRRVIHAFVIMSNQWLFVLIVLVELADEEYDKRYSDVGREPAPIDPLGVEFCFRHITSESR